MQIFNAKTRKIIVSCLFLIILGVLFYAATKASAAITTEINWPKIPGVDKEFKDFTLPDLVKYIFNFFIAIGGLTAFVMIVYGGVKYLTSAGNPSAITEAKDRIFSALLGLLLLLGSYLLLRLINPDLLILPSI